MIQLNPLIHQEARLRIMAALVSLDDREKVDFTFLQKLLNLTAGNLSVHLQKLEEAGYVTVEKTFVNRRPRTWLRVTKAGREAFAAHVDALEAIIRAREPTGPERGGSESPHG